MRFIIVFIVACLVGVAVGLFVHPALGLAALFGTFYFLYRS